MKKFFVAAFAIGFVTSAALVRSQAVSPPVAMGAAAPDSTPPAIPPDQQATKQQLAKLFEVMKVREQTASMMQMLTGTIQQEVRQQVKEMTRNQSASGSLTPEQQAALDAVTNRFLEKAQNLFTVDEMLDDMATLYQRNFTREDVDAYIAFYSTPAGQHLLKTTPIIMQEYMPVMMQRVQQRSKDLTAEMSKEIADVLKSSAPAATEPPVPAPK
jgi:uncharacterized protein